MLDAAAAVLAANAAIPVPLPSARIDMTPLKPVGAQTIALTAQNSDVPAGQSLTTYQWTLVDGGGIVSSIVGATSRDASVTTSGGGRFTIGLTVTDSALATASSTLTVAVAAAAVASAPAPSPPAAPPADSGGGALGMGWLLALGAGGGRHATQRANLAQPLKPRPSPAAWRALNACVAAMLLMHCISAWRPTVRARRWG